MKKLLLIGLSFILLIVGCEEVINVSAIGKGSVTIKDIEKELENVFAEKNIDASSGIKVNITLDDENSFTN